MSVRTVASILSAVRTLSPNDAPAHVLTVGAAAMRDLGKRGADVDYARHATVAHVAALGVPKRDVAAALGVSPSQISKMLKSVRQWAAVNLADADVTRTVTVAGVKGAVPVWNLFTGAAYGIRDQKDYAAAHALWLASLDSGDVADVVAYAAAWIAGDILDPAAEPETDDEGADEGEAQTGADEGEAAPMSVLDHLYAAYDLAEAAPMDDDTRAAVAQVLADLAAVTGATVAA
jgi:DNA-binding transcriptional regulator YdaS (Cro superfamily)